ncbi:DUF6675 family protein [Treponema sp.]|uniref:DUF6675 family protein n=1 Tax=Treponema sp. TaxID=166 RepID=UPI00298DA3C4|nr:DUF6675 family protein [Treponema sp.]MCR5613214.1 hypothetical protein [Treponema sp.]
MKKFLSINAILLFSILCSSFCFAQNSSLNLEKIFNQKLTDSEKKELLQGKIIYKNIKSSSNISLIDAENILKPIKDLKPNYLAEIIRIIPSKNFSGDLIVKLSDVLEDIPAYKGIPYYSEHNKIWVDLYSEAKIHNTTSSKVINDSVAEWVTDINAEFYMEPFGTILSKIQIHSPIASYDDYLIYENTNTSTVMYGDFTCVKPGKMKSMIYVFEVDGYYILYGIGGLNAPKVPFLSSRIELSFMNRIKTFCNFVFTKLG